MASCRMRPNYTSHRCFSMTFIKLFVKSTLATFEHTYLLYFGRITWLIDWFAVSVFSYLRIPFLVAAPSHLAVLGVAVDHKKLLHLPSWMTPRWLHTIRKAGDVKNGWHKYNYVIHTGCMVKKTGQKHRHFGRLSTWCFVKSNLQEPLRSSEATGTCRFWLPNWWFWNRLRHTWPMAAIAVALYKDIYIHRYGWFPQKLGVIYSKMDGFFVFFLWKTPLKMEDLGGTPIFGKHPNRDVDMSDM